MKSRFLVAVGLAVVIGEIVGALAQTPVRPAFEVVSIKHSRADEAGGGTRVEPGGRFTAVNIPAPGLLSTAFGTGRPLFYSQISGMPVWATADRFDITAKTGSDLPSDAASLFALQPALFRALLEDRFKLKAHMETRQEQIYALVLLKSDGSLGPKLKRSTSDCRASGNCGIHFGTGALAAGSVTISTLAGLLAGSVQRVVIDHTDLAGNFDFDLQWSAGLQADAGTGDAALSIFTAVQEQLGLKLESTKGPVDVLVIDHIEPPTPD